MYMFITMRRTATDKPEVIKEVKSIAMGTMEAELLYIENQADQVALIEYNADEPVLSERYNVLFKLERHCKHRQGLQAIFNFKDGSTQKVCWECRLVFGTPLQVNEELICEEG